MVRISMEVWYSLLADVGLLSHISLGVIDIYEGEFPEEAGDPAEHPPIARITLDGKNWEEGLPEGGLNFEAREVPLPYLKKPDNDRWVLKALATGKADWFRLRSNASELFCIEGVVSDPYYTLYIGDGYLTEGEERDIESFEITFAPLVIRTLD